MKIMKQDDIKPNLRFDSCQTCDFEKQIPAINKHISNIIEQNELDNSTCSILEQVQNEGQREVKRKIKVYNLDLIIPIGYRVNSRRGIEFRKWTSSILKEYMVKGYTINK